MLIEKLCFLCAYCVLYSAPDTNVFAPQGCSQTSGRFLTAGNEFVCILDKFSELEKKSTRRILEFHDFQGYHISCEIACFHTWRLGRPREVTIALGQFPFALVALRYVFSHSFQNFGFSSPHLEVRHH